jgi:uncharacterized protein
MSDGAADRLRALLAAHPDADRAFAAVRDLGLPDCWIGAGLVRNTVWDHLHERTPSCSSDIDVVFFDPEDVTAARERNLETRLREMAPGLPWSARNQARMHRRNGHAPYRSTAHALTHWVETATAVAARSAPHGTVEILAPLGLGDLFGLVLRPGPAYRTRLDIFHARIAAKGWLVRWPKLVVAEG